MRERDIRPDAEAAGADGGNSVVCPSVKLIPEVSRVAARRERKARAMKIACAVLVPFCVIVIVFAWLLNARSLGIDGTGNTDSAYGTVLADIEGITQANPRIVDIAMLGAHDANTSSLSVSCGADDSVESPLLSAIFPISSGFQYRYAVTQTVSPYRLMMQGARFMHFKFARIDGVYRASHSVLGREFGMCSAFWTNTPGKWSCSFSSARTRQWATTPIAWPSTNGLRGCATTAKTSTIICVTERWTA